MKAKFVLENIEFERGLDPKSSMGIGRESMIKNIIAKEAEKYGMKIRMEKPELMYWRDEVGNSMDLEGLHLNPEKIVLFLRNSEDYEEDYYGAIDILKAVDSGELDDTFFYEG